MFLGIALGLAIGVLPALGGIAGLSLLIPFIYGMDQVSALAMLIGLLAIMPTGDTFSSILLGIPGGSSSQATVLDGFPLAKKGEAARALSTAFISSMFGGIFGAVVLTGFVFIARPVILAFGSAELFMLALLGLSMVAVLSGRSLVKGIAACCLGLVIGSIGAAPATGEFRLVYDIEYLYDGIPLVVVGMGVFAIPEIVDLMRSNSAIAGEMPLGKGWTRGIRDWANNWFLSLRCAAVGCIVGVIPGLGGSVVDWIAYGHAVQTTKDTSNFGKGDIRGVIAPESANNAMTGGAMLPTILFGIPGSGAMAVFLGCMVLIGIEPGPSMVTTDLHLTYTMIWSLALANIFGALACVALARPISGLTKVPFQYMAPFLMVMIAFAAFQSTRSVNDLLALLALGVVGVLMKRFGWSRPALLIGYVLAPQAETFLYQAVQFNGWEFLTRTGVIIIGLMTLASVFFGLRNRVDEHGNVVPVTDDVPDVPQFRAHLPQIGFAAAIFGVMVIALYDSLQHDFLGKVFPLSVTVVGIVMLGVLLWELWHGKPGHHSHFDAELIDTQSGSAPPRGLWAGLGWMAALILLAVLLGFVLAVAVFFLAFMRLRAGATWLRSLHLTAWAVGGIITAAWLLTLNFPSGLLQSVVDLPWPLR
ncbi:tripartite tricarboxylate transporter permease (plasmid) [Gemmobacter fulvus]|uniref:Tripartite tricarboxylate transporter permease n=2 Tax=Gemmobacter fulvus TaxID=2840474 RepID=A0A975PB35_9RHOB|nr:tripartite tricarboxylate transporter permease [Gemmobacter fulvus]MBT9246428.1 tripartite tricarboxylate transporter permease [Gemmobacter fulvus]QWK92790.1 tripartite tricarboxylate transporter permease [Gemmobacter fulvus]